MGNLVVVGLSELRPVFGPYEQFVSHLWNVFSGYSDRRSLWNGTLKKQRHSYTTQNHWAHNHTWELDKQR